MQARYSAMNQALHWITALCMLAVLVLAWVMTNAARTLPGLEGLYNWHKTFGVIILLVTVFRIAWRFADPPPPLPPALSAWERRLAHATYGLLFLVLLWMPITGYLFSTWAGHPPELFALVPTPQLLPSDKGLAKLAGELHDLGQWGVYALIVLHLMAVAFHLIFRRDGVLGRILPPNATEPADGI